MITNEYIRGLVDGEGSFTVYVRNPRDTAERLRRAKVEPRFIVKLQERDLPILKALQLRFGCGKIYRQPDNRPNHQNCFRFEVFNRTELREIIVPFFQSNPPLAPSKRRDFDLFSTIVEMLASKKHTTLHGLEEIWNLKRQMHRGSLDAGNPLVQWESGRTRHYRNPPVTPRKLSIPEVGTLTARRQPPKV